LALFSQFGIKIQGFIVTSRSVKSGTLRLIWQQIRYFCIFNKTLLATFVHSTTW